MDLFLLQFFKIIKDSAVRILLKKILLEFSNLTLKIFHLNSTISLLKIAFVVSLTFCDYALYL